MTGAVQNSFATYPSPYRPPAELLDENFNATMTSVATYAALRLLTSPSAPTVWLQGRSAPGDGGEGVFWCDVLDTTTVDNDGTVLVDAGHNRWKRSVAVPLDVKWFGATGGGTVSDNAAVQAAITAAAGEPVYFPTGRYRFTAGVSYVTTSSAVFTPGLKLFGDGPGLSIIVTEFAGAAITVDTSTTNKFQLDGLIRGLEITSASGTSGITGISLRRAYNTTVENVLVHGLTADGVLLPVSEGDGDACNMLALRHVRITDCQGWGVHLNNTGAFNETSFTRMEQVFIQACGTNSGSATPPSGGMLWKGQILSMESCAFTLNENCATYIPGGAGLATHFYATNTDWENNKKRSVYCTGIEEFRINSCQVYNNDAFVSTTGIEFDGATYSIAQVRIDGVTVRATAGNNPYTAFKISGANAELNNCRATGIYWSNFDHAGQTRFDGWQFDQVAQGCTLVAVDPATLVFSSQIGTGNVSPLRLRGIGAVPSTTGEWVQFQLPNGVLTKGASGLAINTNYYAYLFDNAGSVQIELSTTGYSTDTATGYPVKTGDATRLFIGGVSTDGAAAFKTTGNGWLNATRIAGSQVPAYLWQDATGAVRVKTAAPSSDTDGTVVGP